MGTYHQMGNDSRNLLDEKNLKLYKGAILSPVNEEVDNLYGIIEKYSNQDFEVVFDPQLYFPKSRRGKLPEWKYFPSDLDTADQSSIKWWASICMKLSKTFKSYKPQAIFSPASVPKKYDDNYYKFMVKVAEIMSDKISPYNIEVIQTVIISLADLENLNKVAEIASIITQGSASRVYLVINTGIKPRLELQNPEELAGAINLIKFLESNSIRVLVGFSSSDLALWKYAGATDCATGKFFNLRRFTPSRFSEDEGGGGQVSYWFEESLMAFLREADLIRIRKENFLSSSSVHNPYGAQILTQFQEHPGRAWLGISWRQYLYWFAEFEQKIANNKINPVNFLASADKKWGTLDAKGVLFDERQNNGSWIRAWRIAINQAKI